MFSLGKAQGSTPPAGWLAGVSASTPEGPKLSLARSGSELCLEANLTSAGLCPGMGRHRDCAGHGDPVLRVVQAAEHPTRHPPHTGVSALRDTQTSPTGHRIPFCDISPATGMIFLAELSGSPRDPQGRRQGYGVRPQRWAYFSPCTALPRDRCCPRTCCFNDSIPVLGVGRKRWGLCK